MTTASCTVTAADVVALRYYITGVGEDPTLEMAALLQALGLIDRFEQPTAEGYRVYAAALEAEASASPQPQPQPTLVETVETVERATAGAYSYPRYSRGGWRQAIRILLRTYSAQDTMRILLSRIPRWAADQHSARYGSVPGSAITTFVTTHSKTVQHILDTWN